MCGPTSGERTSSDIDEPRLRSPHHVRPSHDPFLKPSSTTAPTAAGRGRPRRAAAVARRSPRADAGQAPTRRPTAERRTGMSATVTSGGHARRSWTAWRRTTSRTLVGRDAELTELASLLGVRAVPADAQPGAPAVLLAGDAGVGKTRLLRELRDLAVAEGWQVRAGHCLDFGDSALPYLPVLRGPRPAGRRPARRRRRGRRRATPPSRRLQPGRRMLARRDRAGGRRRRPPRPRRPVRGRARRCSRRSPSAPRCCWSSRTCTGPTSPPATC